MCTNTVRNQEFRHFKTFRLCVPFLEKQETGQSFVQDNWGVLLCMAGITGGVFAGVMIMGILRNGLNLMDVSSVINLLICSSACDELSM